MTPFFITSVGLWAPGYPSAEAWARRQADPSVRLPSGALLPPSLRRRASVLTRAGAEAYSQAATEAGADLGSVPTVWVSAWGEIVTTVEMLEEMATDSEGLPSPTRFHNSVHNTAAGYVSIATGNRSFSTSLAGGYRSVAVGFIEAAALFFERGGDAILVALDEPPPPPFAAAAGVRSSGEDSAGYSTLAVAFHLTADRRTSSKARIGLATGSADLRVPEPFAAHPCGAALLVVDAVRSRRSQQVPLSSTGTDDWIAQIEVL
jgi:hypothetical protein